MTDLSPEHARVLREVQQSLSDTIGPLREEMRVGFAVQGERLEALSARIHANDETTQRIGLKVDELAERTACLEGSERTSLPIPTKTTMIGAVTTAATAVGAYFSGLFDK